MSATFTYCLSVKRGKRFDEIVAFAKEQTNKINATHPDWEWELKVSGDTNEMHWYSCSYKTADEVLKIVDNIVQYFTDVVFCSISFMDNNVVGTYRIENGQKHESKVQVLNLAIKDEECVKKVKECIGRICTKEWVDEYILEMYESDFSESYVDKSVGSYVFCWRYDELYSQSAIDALTRQIIAEVPNEYLYFYTIDNNDLYRIITALGRPVNGKIEWQPLPDYFDHELWQDMLLKEPIEGEQCEIPFDLFTPSEGFKKWLKRINNF